LPPRAGLKWPNDLVVDGSKLAGVLAEADGGSPGGPPGSTAVVVGIGLNIEWPGPPEAGGTCLRQLADRTVYRDELLEALLASLQARRATLDSADGRTRSLEEVRARCVTLGQRVRVTLARETVEGLATGLDDGGRLTVQVGSSLVAVSAGDVVHLR
jgi:BirA family biotin operon repressor/biotin-[acetyl-CoA-carboxylase] ligase